MLYLVATPIGDISEISKRAITVLSEADVILCESTKETSRLLKHLDIKAKKYEILNEHSTLDDLNRLTDICATQTVALVSDCGTPGFCDPGNNLIHFCRKKNIEIKSILGPSSLMGLLSLSSVRLDQFVFRGFLPAENEKRTTEWLNLKKEHRAIVLMDTPYRLRKTLTELVQHFNQRQCLLALNLSQDTETLLEGSPSKILQHLQFDKAEFMLLIYPTI